MLQHYRSDFSLHLSFIIRWFSRNGSLIFAICTFSFRFDHVLTLINCWFFSTGIIIFNWSFIKEIFLLIWITGKSAFSKTSFLRRFFCSKFLLKHCFLAWNLRRIRHWRVTPELTGDRWFFIISLFGESNKGTSTSFKGVDILLLIRVCKEFRIVFDGSFLYL